MDVRILKREVWPYQAIIKMPTQRAIDELIPLDEWCKTTVGKRFVDWYGYGLNETTRMYAFKDEATLLVFKITWGNYGTW